MIVSRRCVGWCCAVKWDAWALWYGWAGSALRKVEEPGVEGGFGYCAAGVCDGLAIFDKDESWEVGHAVTLDECWLVLCVDFGDEGASGVRCGHAVQGRVELLAGGTIFAPEYE